SRASTFGMKAVHRDGAGRPRAFREAGAARARNQVRNIGLLLPGKISSDAPGPDGGRGRSARTAGEAVRRRGGKRTFPATSNGCPPREGGKIPTTTPNDSMLSGKVVTRGRRGKLLWRW